MESWQVTIKRPLWIRLEPWNNNQQKKTRTRVVVLVLFFFIVGMWRFVLVRSHAFRRQIRAFVKSVQKKRTTQLVVSYNMKTMKKRLWSYFFFKSFKSMPPVAETLLLLFSFRHNELVADENSSWLKKIFSCSSSPSSSSLSAVFFFIKNN